MRREAPLASRSTRSTSSERSPSSRSREWVAKRSCAPRELVSGSVKSPTIALQRSGWRLRSSSSTTHSPPSSSTGSRVSRRARSLRVPSLSSSLGQVQVSPVSSGPWTRRSSTGGGEASMRWARLAPSSPACRNMVASALRMSSRGRSSTSTTARSAACISLSSRGRFSGWSSGERGSKRKGEPGAASSQAATVIPRVSARCTGRSCGWLNCAAADRNRLLGRVACHAGPAWRRLRPGRKGGEASASRS